MTADEAKQALKAGKKVRCKKWFIQEDSYISKEKYDYWLNVLGTDVFEDFKDDEWEIVE